MNRREIESFPPDVARKLRTYVYRLIDPRSGETFYVGKGQGALRPVRTISKGANGEGAADTGRTRVSGCGSHRCWLSSQYGL